MIRILLWLFYLFFVICTPLNAVFAAKSPLQLSLPLMENIDVKNYLVSEKYDGVRGYWNGKEMYTRNGNKINLPTWFINDFPNYPLDGELWAGRNNFAEIASLVNTQKPDVSRWKHIRYMVFDLPQSSQPFIIRYQLMQQQLNQLTPYLEVISQLQYETKVAINIKLKQVISAGGEGLMLHHQQAFYQIGRTKALLKLKPVWDAEAKVIAHIAGKGKFQGVLGAIRVEMPNGTQFNIGSGFSDKERQYPPKIGSIITYQYRGFTSKQKPKFATFLRIRSEQL